MLASRSSANVFEIASVDMRISDVVQSYLGLLCLSMSMSDYDAIENFRQNKPFQRLLTLQEVPSTVIF
jgi:hypothetical protein